MEAGEAPAKLPPAEHETLPSNGTLELPEEDNELGATFFDYLQTESGSRVAERVLGLIEAGRKADAREVI